MPTLFWQVCMLKVTCCKSPVVEDVGDVAYHISDFQDFVADFCHLSSDEMNVPQRLLGFMVLEGQLENQDKSKQEKQ